MSITYRPSFDLPKNYHTDGNPDSKDNLQTPLVPLEKPKDILIEEIERIRKVIHFVPDEIKKLTNTNLDLVHFFLVLIDEDKIVDEDVTVITPKDDEELPPGYENLFPDEPPPVLIEKEKNDQATLIESKYYQNILDIVKNYLDRLKEVYLGYHCLVMNKPELVEVLSLVFEGSLSNLPTLLQNIGHSLIRSQQAKMSKLRLSQKLFNEQEALTLLKSLEYSKLTLLRLSKESPSNTLLAYKHVQAIHQEERKLERKYYELYRYLDSSLIITEECLNLHATEANAKAELKKAEVVFSSDAIKGKEKDISYKPSSEKTDYKNPTLNQGGSSSNGTSNVGSSNSNADAYTGISTGYEYVAITQDLLETSSSRRIGTKISLQGITIHSTGNTASAKNERKWLDNPDNTRKTVGWHLCIDDKECIMAIPLNEMAHHAQGGNTKTIGIEICESGNREKTVTRAAQLTAQLMCQYNLSMSQLYRHEDWYAKGCPRIFKANNWQGWKEFRVLVEKYIKEIKSK